MRWAFLVVILVVSLPFVLGTQGISSPVQGDYFSVGETFEISVESSDPSTTELKVVLDDGNNPPVELLASGSSASFETSWQYPTDCTKLSLLSSRWNGQSWIVMNSLNVFVEHEQNLEPTLLVEQFPTQVMLGETAVVSVSGYDPNHAYKLHLEGDTIQRNTCCAYFMGCIDCSLDCDTEISFSEETAGSKTYTLFIEDSDGNVGGHEQITIEWVDPCDGADSCDAGDSYRCVGDRLDECSYQGSGVYCWEERDSCAGSETCNAQEGSCDALAECDSGTECSDGDPCTSDLCVAGECQNPSAPGASCGTNKHCTHIGGSIACVDDCEEVADAFCAESQPASSSLLPNYCALGDCYTCALDFVLSGENCVALSPDSECAPGTVECTASQQRLCDADGAWGSWESCPYCVDGETCGECVPAATECVGDALKTCDAGYWSTETCTYGCAGGACIDPCANIEACTVEDAIECLSLTSYRTCGLYGACTKFQWSDPAMVVPNTECNDGGIVRTCQEKNHTACAGELFWYDSCGGKGMLKENCTAAGKVCQEGSIPACVDDLPPCTETYTYECRGQEGVRIDQGCGIVTTLLTCTEEEHCTLADELSCVFVGFCGDPALTRCGSRCIDLSHSRTDCGACGNACTAAQLCREGSCVENPECVIECRSNEECAEGFVCTNPGICGESACVRLVVPELPVNESVEPIPEVTQAVTRYSDGFVTVTVTLDNAVFSFLVENHAPVPIENLSFKGAFAKVIAAHASQLRVRDAAYEVLLDDTLLRFTLPLVAERERFTVTVDHMVDPTYLAYLSLSDLRYDTPVEEALEAAVAETAAVLEIEKSATFDGDKTRVTLSLAPSDTLSGLAVPVEVPKCLAEYAAELDLEGEYRVIQEDPLIAWNFDRLSEPAEISFSVQKEVSQECLDQLKTMAWAERIGKPFNPWISLLIIPGMVIVILFLQHFHPGKLAMSETEFKNLARSQGVPEHQLHAHWEKFKKEQQ
jgi:hypothetical protein